MNRKELFKRGAILAAAGVLRAANVGKLFEAGGPAVTAAVRPLMASGSSLMTGTSATFATSGVIYQASSSGVYFYPQEIEDGVATALDSIEGLP